MRTTATAFSAVILVIALAGCTAPGTGSATPDGSASPGSGAGGASSGAPAGANVALPSCDEVTIALGTLTSGLTLNAKATTNQTSPEDYVQRVCIFTTADTVTQLGVTIADIPFQQNEIDAYAGLPNAIADPRLKQYKAALQTFATWDAADGHLDSTLYLIDTTVSITIQPLSTGDPTRVTLPTLSVEAATDAALAIRALVHP